MKFETFIGFVVDISTLLSAAMAFPLFYCVTKSSDVGSDAISSSRSGSAFPDVFRALLETIKDLLLQCLARQARSGELRSYVVLGDST